MGRDAGPMRLLGAAILAIAAALMARPICAQEDQTLLGWSQAAARGIFDLCRQGAPDANQVIEHAEIWGWPRFMAYQETPQGYTREAGGQSRRSYRVGDASADVAATVQSGEVATGAEAKVEYFRCNVDSNQPIEADLEAYFTGVYGPPTAKTDQATTWVLGASAGGEVEDDAAALKPVVAQGAGAQGERIELSREGGRDRAKLTVFRNVAAR